MACTHTGERRLEPLQLEGKATPDKSDCRPHFQCAYGEGGKLGGKTRQNEKHQRANEQAKKNEKQY